MTFYRATQLAAAGLFLWGFAFVLMLAMDRWGRIFTHSEPMPLTALALCSATPITVLVWGWIRDERK